MLEIEKFIPKENWYVGLLFNEGYWFFKTIRRQQLTVFKPFDFEDGTAIAVNATSGWEAPADALGRFYLEPQEEDIVYQIFLGISPSQAKMYLDYEQRDDRMNLITPRLVPGPVGFWEGEMTSYNDPSPMTQLWTVHDIYPYFNVENPGITNEAEVVSASFWITPYTYQVIEDKQKILSFLRGEKRCTVHTMGDGFRPIK
ncbi:unnamed protein product, partial [marine sediment metagenome]